MGSAFGGGINDPVSTSQSDASSRVDDWWAQGWFDPTLPPSDPDGWDKPERRAEVCNDLIRNGTLHMACAPGDSACVELSEVVCVYDKMNGGAWRRALAAGYDEENEEALLKSGERQLTHLSSSMTNPPVSQGGDGLSRAPTNPATAGHDSSGAQWTPYDTTATGTSTSAWLISYRARLFCSLGDVS